MTLNKYIEELQSIVTANPRCGDLQVFYAIDDEGNGYRPVIYGPCIMKFGNPNDYMPEPEDDKDFTAQEANAVVIN